MESNGAKYFNKIIQTVIAAMLITALVGLIALRDTARANTMRLDRIEPATIQTAKDISIIKTDVAVIAKTLEIRTKEEK